LCTKVAPVSGFVATEAERVVGGIGSVTAGSGSAGSALVNANGNVDSGGPKAGSPKGGSLKPYSDRQRKHIGEGLEKVEAEANANNSNSNLNVKMSETIQNS
jgi:hypothetical protein